MKKIILFFMAASFAIVSFANEGNIPKANKIADKDNFESVFYTLTAGAEEIGYWDAKDELAEFAAEFGINETIENVRFYKRGEEMFAISIGLESMYSVEIEPCYDPFCLCPLPPSAPPTYEAGVAFMWKDECSCIGGCAIWGEE